MIRPFGPLSDHLIIKFFLPAFAGLRVQVKKIMTHFAGASKPQPTNHLENASAMGCSHIVKEHDNNQQTPHELLGKMRLGASIHSWCISDRLSYVRARFSYST